jgi:hypothetical protein
MREMLSYYYECCSSEPGSISQEEFEDLLSLLSAILGITVLVAAFLQVKFYTVNFTAVCQNDNLHGFTAFLDYKT